MAFPKEIGKGSVMVTWVSKSFKWGSQSCHFQFIREKAKERGQCIKMNQPYSVSIHDQDPNQLSVSELFYDLETVTAGVIIFKENSKNES